MPDTERAFFLTGKPFLPEAPMELSAGRLTVQYETGRIRYIRLGAVEIIRMIYSAVRDSNWGTVEPIIHDEKMDVSPDGFDIHYLADYQQRDIQFQAEYSIKGRPDGIRFTMRGSACSDFHKNRIGFCILHPIKECEGRACIVKHPDGSFERGEFPRHISPHQPFKNIQSMNWRPAADIEAEIIYAGDIFEMEDQRNWTDASYKTYCTPLELPFPVRIRTGQHIEQSVELKIQGHTSIVTDPSLKFHVSNETLKIPQLGIGASSQNKPLDAESVIRLKALNLCHYRIDVDLANAAWPADAAREIANAGALNLPLEAALFIEPHHLDALAACVQLLQSAASSIYCLNVFDRTRKATDGELLRRVCPMLRAAFPTTFIGAGTDYFFAELNRNRTPAALIDFLTFSINPQVHAFDHQSLTETLAAHQNAVTSARQFTNGKALHISPVTLKMRSNPNATGPERVPASDELPATVDPRQMSLYGAAWTLGSIKYLAEAGVDAITYFESTGWRGLLQGDQDSELPEKFAAVRGQVFPVWQILKWILEYKNGKIIPVTSSHPLRVDGLMLQNNAARRLIAANYCLQVQNLTLPENARRITTLDENTIKAFMKNPETLQSKKVLQNTILLQPCSVACIDFN